MKISPELLAIAARLKTQDNRATDNPMFSAQEKCREYGYAGDYACDYVWIGEDCELGEVPEGTPGARQVYYKEVWRTVMIAFTEKACENYLRQNRHHFGETRIYAHTLYRNYEMIAIRKWLMSLTDDPAEFSCPTCGAIDLTEAGEIEGIYKCDNCENVTWKP